MDPRLWEWGKLTFKDPVDVLVEYRRLELHMASLPPERMKLSPRQRRLRTSPLKHLREGRDAALFAHGMAALKGTKFFVALAEDQDYDFVLTCAVDKVQLFVPVQLKELPPEDLAEGKDLGGILAGLHPVAPTDTVLAVRLNRTVHVNFQELEIPPLPYSELWFFWCGDPDQSTWGLYGDALGAATLSTFEYPEPPAG